MKILLIDDTDHIRNSIKVHFRKNFEVIEASNGQDAIHICQTDSPDIILCDIMMPKVNGFDVLASIKDLPHLQESKILMVSAISDVNEKLKCYELGAHDYITKPFNMKELKAKINVFAKLKQAKSVENAFIYTISALARAAEANDEDTGQHILRVNEYSYLIAKGLDLPDEFCQKIKIFAQMHDIGKVHVHPDILKKPSRLTEQEFHTMTAHPGFGAKIIGDEPYLKMAKDIALTHHEKWDGSGYPRGLKEEQIPLSGRIVALADIYDALRSKRVYKPSFSHEKAVDILTNGDDRLNPMKSFDPNVLSFFQKNHKQLEAIYIKFQDQ